MKRLGVGSHAFLALGLVLALATAADADPRDTVGPLDIETVRASRQPSGTRVRVLTYRDWPRKLIDKQSRNRIWLHLDTDGDSLADHRAEIFSTQDGLVMRSSGKGAAFGRLAVRHPNGHTLVIRLPAQSRINPDRTWRLYATSRFFGGSSCSSSPCRDRAPDYRRWVDVPSIDAV